MILANFLMLIASAAALESVHERESKFLIFQAGISGPVFINNFTKYSTHARHLQQVYRCKISLVPRTGDFKRY